MKRVMSYLWMLPQNLLGQLLRFLYKGEDRPYNDAIVRYSPYMGGGISLGRYIIVDKNASEKTIQHEYGHCLQSRKLGWLYLLIVGLPSLLHAGFCRCRNHSYYDIFPENWADKLGGVKR